MAHNGTEGSAIIAAAMRDLGTTPVNANWGRNMLIASQVLGRAAGISWHAVECEQELTVVEALRTAMRDSEYEYEQLALGLALLARYLQCIHSEITPPVSA